MNDPDVTAGTLLVTEYEALKREQAARIGTRDNLVYATLAAMGLVIAAGLREHTAPALLLLLPPVVLVLGWTRTANDIKVTHIGRYLRCEVAPRFTALTGQPALGWEHAHRADTHRRLRMVCQTVADLVLFVAAPLAALSAYWLAGPQHPLLAAVSIGEALLTTALAVAIVAYSGLTDQHPGPATTTDEETAMSNTPCPGCGSPTNSNGNCFNNSCWNANSKRHDGINR